MGQALVASAFALQGVNSIVGGFQNASALRAQGDFKQKAGALNERIGNLQAEDAEYRGDKDAAAYKKQVSQTVGKQRAALAAQGIDVNSGSAADLQMDTAEIGALDALTIRNNARREAWGYKIAAGNAALEGTFAKMSAENQARSSILSGGISALGSFAQAGSNFSGGVGKKKLGLEPDSDSWTSVSGGSYYNPSGVA